MKKQIGKAQPSLEEISQAERVAMDTRAASAPDFTLIRADAGNSGLSSPPLVASLKTVAALLARGHNRPISDQHHKDLAEWGRRIWAARGGFSNEQHQKNLAPGQNYVTQEKRNSCLVTGLELDERNGDSNANGSWVDHPDRERLHDVPGEALKR
jgi:hypothetical protein